MIGMAHCQMASGLLVDNDIDNSFDPYWNDVVVLCNFRTAVGSNVFFDEKSQTNFDVYPVTPIVPVIDSSKGAGNYRSGYFAESNENRIKKDLGTWCTNTTLLTIEFFFHPVEYPSNPYSSYHLCGPDNATYPNDENIYYTSTGKFQYGSYTRFVQTTNSFPPNQTYYIKLTFDGSSIKIYVNDILEGTLASTDFWKNGDKPICLGYSYSDVNRYITYSKGYFDNFRITKAVRPSGFGVVPTKSFPTK